MMTVAATPHTTFFLLSIPLHESLVLTKVPSNLVFVEDSIFFGIRLYGLLGFGFGSGSSIFEIPLQKNFFIFATKMQKIFTKMLCSSQKLFIFLYDASLFLVWKYSINPISQNSKRCFFLFLLTVVFGNVDDSDPNPQMLFWIRVKLIKILFRNQISNIN